MQVATNRLQDSNRPVHGLESLVKVLASMVVKSEVRVAVSDSSTVHSDHLLLNNKCLGLQLNGLEEVSVPVLDVGHFGNTSSDILSHGASDLEKSISSLVVEVKGLV